MGGRVFRRGAWARASFAVVLCVIFAVLTSLSNGTASVLQRRAAMTVGADKALHVSLIGALVRRRVWLAGIVLVVLAAVFQAVALATGPIAVVQPIFIIELPGAILLGAVVFSRPLGRDVWLAVIAVTGGLAVGLAAAAPRGGTDGVPDWHWAPALVGTGGAILLLTVAGMRFPGEPRAALFGLAAAFGYALTAALLKDATAQRHGGLAHLATSWQVYATAVVGLGALFLLQNALQAGSLVASQPMLTLGDALLSTLFGVVLFSEHIRLGWWLLPEIAALAVIAAGCVVLARHMPRPVS